MDSTFYALPARRTVARWAQITPPRFAFDVKLHRLLSRHVAPVSSLPADLRDRATVADGGRVRIDPELEEAICERTLRAVEPLRARGKFSSFLLQLTPAFEPRAHSLEELEPLLAALRPVPVAIELRHRAWLRDPEPTLEWFRAAGAVFVCVDVPRIAAPHAMPPFDAVTREDLAYIRAHGRNEEGYVRGRSATARFDWEYSEGELEEIARRARGLAADADTVRLMFGNGSHAPGAAERMSGLLARGPAPR